MRLLRPLAAIAVVAALIGAAPPAQSEQKADAVEGPAICAPHEAHARYLANTYGEFPLFSGVAADGIALQLFVNRATGSWTALLVRGDGIACVTSAGENGRQDVGL
jgi:hypothetical protein